MPPSGFTAEQNNYIVGFLKSISSSLIMEGQIRGLLPKQALESECGNIHSILLLLPNESIKTNVLRMTLSFYMKILERDPTDYDAMVLIVDEFLPTVVADINSIKVPEIT